MLADSNKTSYTLSSNCRLSTPEPMVALPCGSRSTNKTRCPTLAKPAAKLTADVVLPTPPFDLQHRKSLPFVTLFSDEAIICPRPISDQNRLRTSQQFLQEPRHFGVRSKACCHPVGDEDNAKTVQEAQNGNVHRHEYKVIIPWCCSGSMNCGKKAK